jgi:hypothetical protein
VQSSASRCDTAEQTKERQNPALGIEWALSRSKSNAENQTAFTFYRSRPTFGEKMCRIFPIRKSGIEQMRGTSFPDD